MACDRNLKGLAILLLGLTAFASTAWADEKETHWSFVAPTRPVPPNVKKAQWMRNPIDAFVLHRLEEEGLTPAPEADRATLVRRLSFDLIGLPPSPEEVDAFIEDLSDHAYEKVVDRLLASPHFGERQAQTWLDLARYADTDGFEFDEVRPDMWRYRDWVVSAMNRDLPFDQFVRLQLAGDEVAPGDSEALIATGFNRLYPDMVDLNDQGLRRQNALNDITETTGSVFLGLTIGCARCHDHKSDPIKQKEFYAIQAFFAGSRFRDDLLVASGGERTKFEEADRVWKTEVGQIRKSILAAELPVREKFGKGRPPGISDDVVKAFEKPEGMRSFEDDRLIFESVSADKRVSMKDIESELDDASREQWKMWRARLRTLGATKPLPLPMARGLSEDAKSMVPTFLLRRGDYGSKGPEVAPEFPRSLDFAGTRPPIAGHDGSSGRRAALAEWLVRPDHPLTSRVIVNRLWQGHFGRGLVASSNDFGVMGEAPTHPELMDWLATEMIDAKWSLKAMHRLIIMSASYRQSARLDPVAFQKDPENTLLWRHSRVRLDGETIRDAILFASGKLNLALGGPCVFPELPKELTKQSGKGAIWPVSAREEDRNRRSLYVFLRRNLRYPLFEAFDKPDTNASCPRRSVTTIAPQALSLLNGLLSADSARELVKRIERDAAPDPSAKIKRAFRLALGRLPNPDEEQIAIAFVEKESLEALALALINLNEFIYID